MHPPNAICATLAVWVLGGVQIHAETVWQLEARAIPFDDSSPAVQIDYHALDHAEKHWLETA